MSYISFQPQDYFNTKLYTGNGSTNAITGVGFQPDWYGVRIENQHTIMLYDAVRGVNKILHQIIHMQKTLITVLTSFDSDGFTLGSWN